MVHIQTSKYIDRISFRKRGGIVTVVLGRTTSEIALVNQTFEVGKAPEGFVPNSAVYTIMALTLNNIPSYFAISSNGNITMRIKEKIQSDIPLYASFTYVI